MIVSTCSFGSTGSSAVSDYLKECENVHVMDKLEFTIAPAVDGLQDLEYNIMKKCARQSSSIYAIQRFRKLILSKRKGWNKRTGISYKAIENELANFIHGITQVEYVGFSPMIDKKHSAFLKSYFGNSLIEKRFVFPLEKRHIIKENINFYPLEKVQMSIKPDNFYEASKVFTSNILREMGVDLGKTVVLDQAFSGCDPAGSFLFYDDPYAIVVDRDPRDLYIFAKKVLLSRGRFMPSDTVENFVTYYRKLRENQPYRIPNERILLIQFEEMVYNYEVAVSKIDRFLNVQNDHRKTIFVPEMSVANTNLIRKYPEFAEDVRIIEEQLSEYLFHFEQYNAPKENGTMFFGRSKLNPVQVH